MDDASIGQLTWRWGAKSHIGKVRQENEDAFVIEAEVGLFVVCDGMGGHRGGALAANIVAQDLPPMIESRLHRLRSQKVRAIRSMLKKTIAEQNRQLHMEGESEVGYKGMGATVVVVLLCAGRAYMVNLGDSRGYVFRAGKLSQWSKDHSVVSSLLRRGLISEEQAQNHEAQGEITRFVGMEEEARPYVRTFEFRRGDRLLLCSDGLTGMVSDEDIAEILKDKVDPQAACDALVEAANAAGGFDNITVVVVAFRETPSKTGG